MIRGPHCVVALTGCAALLPLLLAANCDAQSAGSSQKVDVTAEIRYAVPAGHYANSEARKSAPAVLWLNPLPPLPATSMEQPQPHYTLTQKNKMFSPHLLVVPLGTVVLFPNQDPFFHNVFSLFDGKRFDLGLYEAGGSRSVSFSREGVSYIFCNIHPEMSAVVISLRTALHAVASPSGTFRIHDTPVGEYELHIWVEGQPQTVLDRWVRRVHIDAGSTSLGTILVPAPVQPVEHLNKFQQPYSPSSSPY